MVDAGERFQQLRQCVCGASYVFEDWSEPLADGMPCEMLIVALDLQGKEVDRCPCGVDLRRTKLEVQRLRSAEA